MSRRLRCDLATGITLTSMSTNCIWWCSHTMLHAIFINIIDNVIHRCHSLVGHSGRDKTWAKVKDNYSRVPHGLIKTFLKTCVTCVPRAKVKKAPCGRPIISSRFLQRLQMDLIDFTSQPDGDMKWILHLRDHFTKYSWGCALPNKQAVGVATKLKTTFCMFGAPEILQVLSYVF